MLTRRRARESEETNETNPSARTARTKKILGLVPMWVVNMVFDVLSVLVQIGGVIATPWLFGVEGWKAALIPVSVILVSCGWWENYASCEQTRRGL